MSNNKYIIIGNQIAGPLYDETVGYAKKYLTSLPRYDIPPSLQKELEGRTEVTEGVDFFIKNGKVVSMPLDESKLNISELSADWTLDQKDTVVKQSVIAASNILLHTYFLIGLKDGIECGVLNDPTNEHFVLSFKKIPQGSPKQGIEETPAGPWTLRPHSYQIADTGDYDGHYELTDGKISLLTKDDPGDDKEVQDLVDALNRSQINFYLDDAAEWEAQSYKSLADGLQSRIAELEEGIRLERESKSKTIQWLQDTQQQLAELEKENAALKAENMRLLKQQLDVDWEVEADESGLDKETQEEIIEMAESCITAVEEDNRKMKALEAENASLKDALHRDQTGLAASLAKMNETIEGYRWLTEGRGPYAWNDDRYKGEVLTMLATLGDICSAGLRESGLRSHAYCCNAGPTYEELMRENKNLKSWLSSLPEEVYQSVPIVEDLPPISIANMSVDVCSTDGASFYYGYFEGNKFSAYPNERPVKVTHWLKKINLKDLPGQQNDAHSENFLLHLIDVTWNEVTESKEVPDPEWSKKIIADAYKTFNQSIWFEKITLSEAIASPHFNDLVGCLKELCNLKHYKDNVGKDSFYNENQPLAWKKANDVLNRFGKINLKDLPVQQNDAVAFVKWCFVNYTRRGMEWVRKEDAEKTIVQTFTTEDLYNIFKQKP